MAIDIRRTAIVRDFAAWCTGGSVGLGDIGNRVGTGLVGGLEGMGMEEWKGERGRFKVPFLAILDGIGEEEKG